jgi:hypothetical protein
MLRRRGANEPGAENLSQEFDPETSQPMELELSLSGKQIALMSGEMVLLYLVP